MYAMQQKNEMKKEMKASSFIVNRILRQKPKWAVIFKKNKIFYNIVAYNCI
jgi:hypothetical protein